MVPTCAGWAVRGRRRSGGAEGPPGIVRTFRPRASANWSRDLGRNLGRNPGRTEAGGGAAARGARATRPESLVRMRWGAGYAICRHMGAWGIARSLTGILPLPSASSAMCAGPSCDRAAIERYRSNGTDRTVAGTLRRPRGGVKARQRAQRRALIGAYQVPSDVPRGAPRRQSGLPAIPCVAFDAAIGGALPVGGRPRAPRGSLVFPGRRTGPGVRPRGMRPARRRPG